MSLKEKGLIDIDETFLSGASLLSCTDLGSDIESLLRFISFIKGIVQDTDLEEPDAAKEY